MKKQVYGALAVLLLALTCGFTAFAATPQTTTDGKAADPKPAATAQPSASPAPQAKPCPQCGSETTEIENVEVSTSGPEQKFCTHKKWGVDYIYQHTTTYQGICRDCAYLKKQNSETKDYRFSWKEVEPETVCNGSYRPLPATAK